MPLDRQVLNDSAGDDLKTVQTARILKLLGRDQFAETFAERLGHVLLELLERRLPTFRF